MQGEICDKGTLSQLNETLSLAHYSKGIYFIICESKHLRPVKIIKTN